ncbi:MAG: hypothetical protein OXB95_04760 [Rhodobacteraceae bacterium]|nr:hypothetical protein [Paracoccaceae bacterium]
MTAIGLGGAAGALEIAPAVTFLGLTPAGWAIGLTAGALIAALGSYFTHKKMQLLNEERRKGGLGPITLK